MNNSDKELRWDLDLSQVNPVLEEGIFKFLHASGTPFLTYEDGGVGGKLEPGQTYGLGVMFCPCKLLISAAGVIDIKKNVLFSRVAVF